jgi:ketosteroid isomerase-like protein
MPEEATMKTAKQVHAEISAAFAAGDMPAQLALFSPQCVVREAPGLPFGGEYVGHEGLQTLFATIGEFFELSATLLDVYEVSDSIVIAHTNMRITSRSTGDSVEMPVLEVFTVQDGLVIEAAPFYWDTQRLSSMANVRSGAE